MDSWARIFALGLRVPVSTNSEPVLAGFSRVQSLSFVLDFGVEFCNNIPFLVDYRHNEATRMPHIETTDLSFIADRVQPQTWTLFQVLRTRMRQMKGVTMKVQYEKHTREPIPAFFYGSRQLFHVHARGEEISATLHADQKARTKIVEDQSIDWRARDQVKKRTWAAFTLRSSKDLVPFMELVRAKYDMINQEASGKQEEQRPVAF